MTRNEAFCKDQLKLPQVRCEIWLGWIMVTLNPDARPVAEGLEKAEEMIADFDMESYVQTFSEHHLWDTNWKVLAENFMESYHHAGTHIKTLQPIMPARDTWTEGEKPDYIRCHLPYGEKARGEIAAAESSGGQWDAFPVVAGLDDDQRHEWGLVMGYPLFTMVTAPDQIVWYRIEPVASDRLRLMTTVMVPESTTRHPDFVSMLERGQREAVGFHLEDMEVLSAVQRSTLSDGYQRGRLSHLEMPVWLIQRFIAARIRGTKPTLDREPAPGQRP